MPRFNGIPLESSNSGSGGRFGGIPVSAPGQEPETFGDQIRDVYQAVASNPIVSRLNEFGSGITRGAARMADLPGRAVYGLIPGVEAPEGGFFEQGAEELGLTVEPTDRTGRLIQRAGEEIGASALPAGAALRYAGTASRLVRPADDVARAGGVGQAVRDIGRQTVDAAARNPRGFAAGEAVAAGAAGVGAQSAREAFPDSQAAEMVGALTPSAAAAGGAAAVRGLMRGGEAGRQTVRSSLGAFDAAGADPTVGQATRRTGQQAVENFLKSFPGGSRVATVADQVDDAIGKQVAKLRDQVSTRASAEQAGRVIQSGIMDPGGFLTRFRRMSQDLYRRLDDQIPGAKRVNVENTKQALETISAPIQGAESLSGILATPRVREIAGAFSRDAGDVTLPYEALSDLRTAVGAKLASTSLIDDVPRGELKQIYRALTRDMERAARDEGEAALRAFKRADGFYSSGIQRVEDVLERVSRKSDPEDIFRAATRGREGGFTVRGVMKSLRPDERSVVSASVINRLGRATPGNQDDIGEVFSVETFLSNWNRMAPEAKRALFDWPQFKDLRSKLDRVAQAAATLREARKAGANPSGTGGIVSQLGAYSVLGGGLFFQDLQAVGAAAGAMLGANAAARLMTSPKFVRWLAQSTEVPIERTAGHLTRLTKIASESDEETAEAIKQYVEVLRQ